LEILDGDKVAIIGPNGSGKSTLVRLLSTELEPTDGKIIFKNIDNNDWSPVDLAKHRSVLSQSNTLSFPFTVIDIIRMGRYPNNISSANTIDDNICKNLLEIFDLSDYSDRNYITLSGGEKQRVQLARVFAQIWSDTSYHGKLLILDEPTSFLDIKHQSMLFDFLEEMNSKGLTIIMVLHDLNHVATEANKVIMMKSAQLVGYGLVEEVFNSTNLKEAFDIDLDLIKIKDINSTIIRFNKKGAIDESSSR
tara:strand:+ start:260 stop:1009 length:750 start_codon:yes stop_codon:yes gene_type:complete